MRGSLHQGKMFFLTNANFPKGDSRANRILELAKCVKSFGIDAVVIGKGKLQPEYLKSENNNNIFEDIEFQSFRKENESVISKIINLFYYGFNSWNKLKKNRIDYIYANLSVLSYLFIIATRNINKKRLIVDVMEWFNPEQFVWGRLNPLYWLFCYRYHFLAPKAKNIIAISRLIEMYYLKKGCHVIRIPPQVDTDYYSPHEDMGDAGILHLFYAGSILKKDYMGIALEGLLLLENKELERISFTLAGTSEKELEGVLSGGRKMLDELRPSLKLLGRISREEVKVQLSKSHFTVLLRPGMRYANAGFPSKVPESLAAGTPVILNLTSDLEMYIKDGKNSLVVSDCTPQAFAQAVRHALQLSVDDFRQMSKNARETAETFFDYRVWTEKVGTYINEAI